MARMKTTITLMICFKLLRPIRTINKNKKFKNPNSHRKLKINRSPPVMFLKNL